MRNKANAPAVVDLAARDTDGECRVRFDHETLELPHGQTRDATWRTEQLAALEEAAKPHDALQLPIIDPIRNLVNASAGATVVGPNPESDSPRSSHNEQTRALPALIFSL